MRGQVSDVKPCALCRGGKRVSAAQCSRQQQARCTSICSHDLTLCPSIPCPRVCTLPLSLARAQLRQRVADLEAKLQHVQQQLQHVQQQHEHEIRQLRAQTATVQTRLFQQRYSEAQPQLTATVEGLQQVVFSLSAQVAANTYTRSHMPPESAIDQFRHGAKLREMTLGAVRRSDTDAEIDLFALACIGKKTGTLRLAEYACTFAVGQFVFLRDTDKRLRLAQVTSVTQPRAWGEVCAHPVLATQLVAMEGLYSPTNEGSACAHHVSFWTLETSSWLAGFWPRHAETDKYTNRKVLKNTTLVCAITWQIV